MLLYINQSIRRIYGLKNPDNTVIELTEEKILERKQKLSATVADWYEHLGKGANTGGINGKIKNNFLYVFDHLDDVIEHINL